MSQYYITHVQPIHLQQGTATRFFIREYNPDGISKTHIVEQDIPYFFYTKPYNQTTISTLEETIKENPEYKHLKISKHTTSNGGHFLQAAGSKENKLTLPEIFQEKNTQNRSPRSPSEQLRWLYPTGLLLENPYTIPQPQECTIRPLIPLEALLKDNYAVLDIEIEGWEQGKDQIFMIVYITPQSHILYHNLPFTKQKLHGFDLIQYQTQQELGHILTLTVATEDPLWIFGHNIMNFDNIKIRNLTKSYLPTANKHYPVTKSTQGLGKVITAGRFTLDTYAYHFFHRNFHANNKLETIAEFEKDIDYITQRNLLELAKKGDHNAFEILATYCIEDGLRTEKIARTLQPVTALKTYHYARDPDSICATSKTALIKDWWDKHYYYTNGLPPPQKPHDPNKPSISAPIVVNTALREGFKPGYHRNSSIIAVTPLLAAGYELSHPRGGGLLEYFSLLSSSLEKLDVALTLQEEITPLIAEIKKLLDPPSLLLHSTIPPKQRFKAREIFLHHAITSNPNQLIHNIKTTLTRTNAALERAGIYNCGTTLYALEQEINVKALEEKLYGVYLGTGPVLSLKPGIFVANPFHEKDPARFIYQGIRPTKGQKTHFEKRMLMHIIGRIFNEDPLFDIKKELQTELTQFSQGQSDPHEYIITKKTRSFYREELREILQQIANPTIATLTRATIITPITTEKSTAQIPDDKNEIDKTKSTQHAKVILEQYQAIQHRIHDRFSHECKKELEEIISQAKDLYCYPYLLEIQEKIVHPYPPTTNLIYAEGLPTQLRPQNEGWALDLTRYTKKAQETFSIFDEVFTKPQTQTQLSLKI